jgi:hypothetical protein
MATTRKRLRLCWDDHRVERVTSINQLYEADEIIFLRKPSLRRRGSRLFDNSAFLPPADTHSICDYPATSPLDAYSLEPLT